MDNVRVIPDAGDVVIVGADTIAKLSAETSEDRSVAAWDQRIVIRRFSPFGCSLVDLDPILDPLMEAVRIAQPPNLRMVVRP